MYYILTITYAAQAFTLCSDRSYRKILHSHLDVVHGHAKFSLLINVGVNKLKQTNVYIMLKV